MNKKLKEKYDWFKKDENIRKIFLFIVLAVCVFEFISIKTEKKKIENTLSLYKYNWRQVIKNDSVPDANDIEPWMTFEYLNFIFKLPKNYLQTTLNINTQKYPNISVQRYARLYNLDLNKFIFQIKTEVNNYNTQFR